MIEINDIVILITGTIYEKLIDDLIKTYSNLEHKIISTWYDPKFETLHTAYAYGGCKPENYNVVLKKLEDAGFILVFNNLVEATKMYENYNNKYYKSTIAQTMQIYNGLVKAKELGYKYVIRCRTDISCEDDTMFNKFINETKYLFTEKLSVICGMSIGKYPYILDVIITGDINEMLLFFDCNYPKDSDKGLSTEHYWLREYFKKKYPDKPITLTTIKEVFNYFLRDLQKHNIEFLWFRPKIYEKLQNKKIENAQVKIVKNYCMKGYVRL